MALTTIIWSTTVHYLREFSSIAGLSHAAKAPSFARSVYWLSIFFLGLAFTIKGLVDIIDEFDDYPVVVNSKLTTRNEVPYPAVTVCNLNRYLE